MNSKQLGHKVLSLQEKWGIDLNGWEVHKKLKEVDVKRKDQSLRIMHHKNTPRYETSQKKRDKI